MRFILILVSFGVSVGHAQLHIPESVDRNPFGGGLTADDFNADPDDRPDVGDGSTEFPTADCPEGWEVSFDFDEVHIDDYGRRWRFFSTIEADFSRDGFESCEVTVEWAGPAEITVDTPSRGRFFISFEESDIESRVVLVNEEY